MREDLKPGDILMYRPGKNWLGKLLSWGEWTGTPGEALEYAHVGIVLSPAAALGFEMNPPSSHYVKLLNEDWSIIDVFRCKEEVDSSILADFCARNAGTPYPYGKIAQLLGAGLFARLGLFKASRWAANLFAKETTRTAVCSATACMALDYATSGRTRWPKESADMRPADIPLGPVYKV